MSISAQTTNDTLQFPQDFFGIYKGDLDIHGPKGKMTIQMEFHLNKTDSVGKYQYMIVYIFEGKRQERQYNLIEKDAANGIYIVDENNGILLDAKVVDNVLYSMFEVQGSLITTTERFHTDYMDFEITAVNTSKKTESGTEGDDAIKVTSYPVLTVQKAKLFKQKD